MSKSLTSSRPRAAASSANTGAFSWSPSEIQDGQYTIVFHASDNHDASTTQTLTITVNELNDAPTLVNPGNLSIDEKKTLNFTLSAFDADVLVGVADSVTFSITVGIQAGMTLCDDRRVHLDADGSTRRPVSRRVPCRRQS